MKLDKIFNYISENVFDLFLWFLIILNILPILAPILMAIGLTDVANVIYTVYSYTCHQFHWRSLHIFDYQVAWCTRDTYIWLSFLTVALTYKFKFINKGYAWYWAIPFTIPIALDGGIQTIATVFGFEGGEIYYLSTNFMRMLTGTIFGMGLSMVTSPFILEEQIDYRKRNNK